MVRSRFKISPWPVVLVLAAIVSLTLHGNLRAAPQQLETDITLLAPEKCVLAVAWTGEIKPDLNGADIERWLAQPEILDGWEDLKELIEKNADESAAKEAFAKLSLQIAFLAPTNPWILYLDQFDLEKPPLRFIVQLNDADADIKKLLDDLKTELGDQAKTITVDGIEFVSAHPEPQATGPVIEFGIYEGYFVLAVGEGSLASLIANFSTPAPAWTSEIQKELPVKRTAGMFRIDTARLMELANAEGDVPPELHLEEMQEVIGIIGLEDGETVTRVALHCPAELHGVLKLLETEPMKIADLSGVPDSLQSLFAARFSPDQIWEILTTNQTSAPDIAEFTEGLKEELGVDFEKDALEAFDDFMYSYQSISLVNPAAGAIAAVRIKNPENFSVRLAEVVEQYNDNDNVEYTVETEDTKTGTLYRVIPKDIQPDFGMALPTPCFSLNDNELIFALDDKAISSHLRKSAREGGKLTADQRVADLFDSSKNGNLGQPLAVHYLDLKSIIEVVYGVVPMFLGGFPGEEDEANNPLDSLPPLEVITNGIQADVIGIYRTEKGFQMWERSTFPNITVIMPIVAGGAFWSRKRLAAEMQLEADRIPFEADEIPLVE